jgi:Ubiquitin carboxyl-terminal hydrolase
LLELRSFPDGKLFERTRVKTGGFASLDNLLKLLSSHNFSPLMCLDRAGGKRTFLSNDNVGALALEQPIVLYGFQEGASPPPPPYCRGLPSVANTCYLNSVLQALFHTPNFVNRILHKDPGPSNSLPFFLQRVMYQMREGVKVDVQVHI